jgi:C-terminal processing protease CtpA/Prc
MWFAAAACLLAFPPLLGAQDLGVFDRDRGLAMLHAIRKDIERDYYDTTFHGVNLATRWDSAETIIRSAQSTRQVLSVIAWTLFGFEDSHTLFIPPARVNRVEYGWELRMVGDSCFVIDVDPRSDAARQGLAPGDLVLQVGRFVPRRQDFWKITYWFYAIGPEAEVPFVIRAPGGARRELTIASKVIPGRQIMDLTGAGGGSDIWDLIRRSENDERKMAFRFAGIDKRALVWRMPTFSVDDGELDRALGKVDDFAALVLDLRGNSGGSERALLRLLGAFTDQTDTIGTLLRRKERVPLVVKPHRQFPGKLVVLVDSRSASAAEILAHTVQMRARGTVVGDRTWGGVMRSMIHSHQVGVDRVVFYAVSVSDAAIVMADSARLEGVGVVPNEFVLPTAADLLGGRDPALARALALVGVELPPEAAGRLFPPVR